LILKRNILIPGVLKRDFYLDSPAFIIDPGSALPDTISGHILSFIIVNVPSRIEPAGLMESKKPLLL
jgi:hypothetical protein